MQWNDPEVRKWVEAIAFTGLSGIGGMIGYIYREVQSERRPNPWRALIEGSAAAFVGILVFLMCDALNLGLQWTGVIVGVFGWLGATATIHVLEKVVFKKLGVSKNESD
jgi:hypothetical protein